MGHIAIATSLGSSSAVAPVVQITPIVNLVCVRNTERTTQHTPTDKFANQSAGVVIKFIGPRGGFL